MKTPITSFFLLFLLIFTSCSSDETEITEDTPDITNIAMLTTSGVTPQEITVKISLGYCNIITHTNTISGNTFNYYFKREWIKDMSCIGAWFEKDFFVSFDPPAAGQYTLNFYFNGYLIETRSVVATE